MRTSFFAGLNWSILALLVLFGGSRLHAEGASVELILDCSGSMWNKLEDGRFRITAAKQVLSEFIATVPEQPGLNLGLRLYGSKIPHREPGACEDSFLAVPIQGIPRGEMLKVVREVKALGATPLARSLFAAADDLIACVGKRQVIVFTDGEESCDGDVAMAIAKLKEQGIDADVRIIGIGLPKRVAEKLAQYAPVENVNSAIKLAEALRAAAAVTVQKKVEVAVVKQSVVVTLVKDGKPYESAEGVTLLTAKSEVLPSLRGPGGDWVVQVPAGIYQAQVLPDKRVFPDLVVARGQETRFTFDLTQRPEVKVTVPAERVVFNQELTVQYEGATAGAGMQELRIVPVGAPADDYISWALVTEPSGSASLRAPNVVGEYEARFVQIDAHQQVHICGRSAAFQVLQPKTTLSLQAEVPAASMIRVDYQAEVQPGDWIGWVKAGAAEGAYTLYRRPTTESQSLEINAPGTPGEYEMRYANDAGQKSLASQVFKVTPASVSVSSASTAMAGSLVQVSFQCPQNNPQLFITIVPKGRDAGAYNVYRRPVDISSPFWLQSPRELGEMELRLADEGSNMVLVSQPLTLTAMQAMVAAEVEPKPASRLRVKWSGPAGEGDFICVAVKGTDEGSYVHYEGVPLFQGQLGSGEVTLTLPEELGEYELRYTTADNRVLARQPLKLK
jgi:Ca-activated chloride channel homolog